MEVQQALREWADRSGCRLLVLFGSGASHAPAVKGDVDLALDFGSLPPPERRLEMIHELARLSEPHSADVVFLHEGTDPVLRFEAFRGGAPIFERQPGTFVRERVRALMLYEDALPFRRARRERLRRVSAELLVAPDVLSRKLERLTKLLDDLDSHRGRTGAEVEADPYEVERLLELLVQVAVDIVAHLLAEAGTTAPSYRAAFDLGGKTGLLPADLAGRLANAAGLRNILVHLYEDVDYEIVAASIGPALEDFSAFRRVMEARLRQMEAEAEGDA